MIRRERLLVALLTAAWVLAIQGAATPAMAQASLEYSVKANYLVRFAAFIEWPAQAFPAPQSPVVICVAGRDPFGPTLDRAARGHTAHGRSMIVRRPTSRDAMSDCNILYLGAGAGSLINAASGHPGMLVVTDAAAAPERGAIHFVLNAARVRFHVNQQAASRSGLRISSRLLNLALSVRPD